MKATRQISRRGIKALALALTLSLATVVSPALAAKARKPQADTAPTARAAEAAQAAKPARKKAVKVKMMKDASGESPADRNRRLQRECRGLPNAGACGGYGYGS